MIEEKRFILVESYGYPTREEAEKQRIMFYGHVDGAETFFDDGLWYIVQPRPPRFPPRKQQS